MERVRTDKVDHLPFCTCQGVIWKRVRTDKLVKGAQTNQKTKEKVIFVKLKLKKSFL